ncbi:hypothetical protein DPEC_G00101640 [Dallia pectoralis]|uniref:Uncharacterized protein n=1 Tax=Dallia pectoralis TaxID=75939 RepID=A0ACC2GX17_DALPE|nr:hypothetical protein DPEC_G00101640 [Dallia pectoralis]
MISGNVLWSDFSKTSACFEGMSLAVTSAAFSDPILSGPVSHKANEAPHGSILVFSSEPPHQPSSLVQETKETNCPEQMASEQCRSR